MNKYLKGILIVLAAIFGGICYRMGGSGNYGRWIREAGQGVATVVVLCLLGLAAWHWRPDLGILLAFGLCWAESTYFKRKGTDAGWVSWLLVGAVFGLVPLPYCWLTNSHWLGFGIRLPLCMGLTVLWQQVLSAKFSKWFGFGKDVSDEVGRGFINIMTLPLLLL